MLTVYRIIPDLDHYQYVAVDNIEEAMAFRFDGTELGDSWKPPATYVANPNKPKPDIWGCMNLGAVIAVSEKRTEVLLEFFDQSCETLPLECDGNSLLLCNVTCVVNALDTNRSVQHGLPHLISKYVFHPGRFEYSLFKIPESAMSELLCVEGLGSPEYEFKGAVEQHGLKGIEFKQIWSGE